MSGQSDRKAVMKEIIDNSRYLYKHLVSFSFKVQKVKGNLSTPCSLNRVSRIGVSGMRF